MSAPPDPATPWRCFVAVLVPDEIRAPLDAAIAPARRELDASWTDPSGWHVTLDFLGPVRPDAIGQLDRAVSKAVSGERRFVARTGGLGAFPSPGRARVLFYGLSAPGHALERLAAATAGAVAPLLGARETVRFRPHVTLARLRRPQAVGEWLTAKTVPSCAFEVADACLMRSHLGRGPARYEVVARFPLAT